MVTDGVSPSEPRSSETVWLVLSLAAPSRITGALKRPKQTVMTADAGEFSSSRLTALKLHRVDGSADNKQTTRLEVYCVREH